MDVGLETQMSFRRGQRSVGLSLSASGGAVTALVGPSGSGKTTLLRLLAGLLRPDEGHIRVNGETWFDHAGEVHLPPQKRWVGMVFQDYALFPHLSALDNVAFARRGLENRRAARKSAQSLLQRVRMGGMERRLPRELSGGQRQRIAVARALAREPSLLLLDEPFAAVDQVVRRKLREELLDLTQALKCAVILVTHDLTEAAMLGTRIGVMHGGALLQIGSRRTVFYQPADDLVARLVDMSNLLPAEVISSAAQETLVRWAGRTLSVKSQRLFAAGEPVWIGIRPEHLLVRRPDSGSRPNDIPGVIRRLLYPGSQARVVIEPEGGGQELIMEISEHLLPNFKLYKGRTIQVCVWPDRAHLMPRK